jgi:hypothetical protein
MKRITFLMITSLILVGCGAGRNNFSKQKFTNLKHIKISPNPEVETAEFLNEDIYSENEMTDGAHHELSSFNLDDEVWDRDSDLIGSEVDQIDHYKQKGKPQSRRSEVDGNAHLEEDADIYFEDKDQGYEKFALDKSQLFLSVGTVILLIGGIACFLLFNAIDWEIVLFFIIPSVYILMMIFFILATFWFSRYRRKKLHEAEPLSRKGKLIGIFSWICLWLFGAGSYAIAAIIGLIAIGVDKRKDRRRDRSF